MARQGPKSASSKAAAMARTELSRVAASAALSSAVSVPPSA